MSMHYASLYLYHFVYFIATGASTFIPKYYGEIGMSNSQIGMLSSIPTLFALLFMPLLGTLSDRVSKKRYLLAATLLIMAAFYLMVPAEPSFATLLVIVSGYTLFSTSMMPIATTISLEYSRQIGREYGPIRLMGTVGYQAGALLVGLLLTVSLRNLFPLMGVISLLTFGITFMMPNVEGHQHSKEKVPMSALLKDRHLRWMYFIIFFCTISSQFYMAFFSKHLGDLGMSNSTVSWITLISVAAELPFLYFGDRIARKTNIWNWLLIAMVANGVRWLGLAFSRSALPIFLCQIPGVTVLACFEFFPALYLNRRVGEKQLGAAQSLLSLVSFGAARIVGSLIGGKICEYTGIPAMFAFLGVMLLAGSVFLWRPTRRLIQDETVLRLS